MTTNPTRFVTAGSTQAKTTMSVACPAAAAIKGGWRMFWLGIWAFIRRRSVSFDMGWTK